MWDAGQYERFRDQRARAFFDLLARVPGEHEPATVADLGCGTGRLTRALLERWPRARVTGVDDSREMLAAAAEHALPGRLDFVAADAASWRPAEPVDLAFSNAMLQWLPDHNRALAHLASLVAPGGSLAVQMPGNFEAPSHTRMREVAAHGPWAGRLDGVLRREAVRPLAWYVERLHALGFAADAWETTYLHVLPGEDAVLEWVKGTALRPVLERLEGAEREAFLAEYGARLREAYPAGPGGTLFPFRRLFFIATRA